MNRNDRIGGSVTLAIIAAVLISLFSVHAFGQPSPPPGVRFNNVVTSGHCVSGVNSTTVHDTGTPCGSGSGTVTAVSVATANGLAGTSSGGATPALTLSTTVTGAIKGNGTALSQAACADLSNGATGCGTAVGTSGATLPLLNGVNTWGGTQTFGATVAGLTTQSGTTYTLAATDCGTILRLSNAASITLTLPNSLAVGCVVAVEQAGAGQVTASIGAGSTLHSSHGFTKTAGQYAIIGLTVDAAGIYILSGDGA